jgi:hypothetical protein
MTHTLGTSIKREHPNRRTPIALVVDDATPCVNPLWFHHYHLDPRVSSKHAPSIPLRFMREWSTWANEAGIAGAFTVLPFPAGLGRIDQSLRGYDECELKEWLNIARELLVPRFDIHPKALSNTLAVKLSDMSLLTDISEHAFLSGQDEQTLAVYLATAMDILRKAGLPSTGTTKPYDLEINSGLLARAALAAEKTVNSRSITHTLIEQDETATYVPPRLLYCDDETSEAVIGIWAGNEDYLWRTQEFERPESGLNPERLADLYITADGTKGRAVELLQGSGPVVLRTHYQSLFSNGTKLGLETMKVVVHRLNEHFGRQIEWVSLSTLASRFVASEKAEFAFEADEKSVRISFSSFYEADVATFTVVLPWRLQKLPEVTCNGVALSAVNAEYNLKAGTFLARGSTVTISVPVSSGTGEVLLVASE